MMAARIRDESHLLQIYIAGEVVNTMEVPFFTDHMIQVKMASLPSKACSEGQDPWGPPSAT